MKKNGIAIAALSLLMMVCALAAIGCDLEQIKDGLALDGTVTIAGIPAVDEILTADTTGLNGSGTISYQWKRMKDDVETEIGTNNASYKVLAEDLGSTITVTVTRKGNIGSITSEPTDIVGELALSGTITIDGTAAVGQTLTANTEELGGDGEITYLWKRGSIEIGSNSAEYTITSDDIGATITVTVSRLNYSGSFTSQPTGYVYDPNLPALSGTVTIVGTVGIGNPLTVNISSLGGSGTVIYQWRRGDGTAIGTNNQYYTIIESDKGSTITVTVFRAGNSGSITSAPTTAVPLPPITGSVTITGTAVSGQTLTANTENLNGIGAITYQWKRGSTDIGTNSPTYTIVQADLGSVITVTVSRIGYAGSITSNPTGTVVLPTLSGSVSITGAARIGKTLTANTDLLDGTGNISYQWRRNGSNVGLNSPTYTLQKADVGTTFTVTVSRAGHSGNITSSATAVVTNILIIGGTVTIPNVGVDVDFVGVQIYTAGWRWSKFIDVNYYGITAEWSTEVELTGIFDNPTEIFFEVQGYGPTARISSLFTITVEDVSRMVAAGDDINVELDLSYINLISLSGSFSFANELERPYPYIVVQVCRRSDGNSIGHTVLENVGQNNNLWSIYVPAGVSDTDIHFNFYAYEQDKLWNFDYRLFVLYNRVHINHKAIRDQPISGIDFFIDLNERNWMFVNQNHFSSISKISGVFFNDGTIYITLEGEPDPESIWQTDVRCFYSGEQGVKYRYEFDAWTDGAEREIEFEYTTEIQDYGIFTESFPLLKINGTRQRYSFTGDELRNSEIHRLYFNCGNDLTPFYIGNLTITPVND